MRAIALIAALCAAPAAAEEPLCVPRGDMQAALENEYGEVSVGYGLDHRDVIVEVWVSRAGTWTLLITRPDGSTCAVAAGIDWVFVEQPWPPMGEEG